MIIPAKSQFNWFGGFWQEDCQGFNQSEHVIGPGSHVEFPIYTKNTNLVADHPMNIYGKFGWNLFSGFREEEINVKSYRTDDGRLPMTKAHLAIERKPYSFFTWND
jgi:hypothetical protein